MQQVKFFMKTVTIQLGTKDDESIVHISKVDTWFYGVIKKSTVMKAHEMFAKAGPKGLSIATPSNCLYIWLLKLNSTPRVAISINSLKVSSGNGGQSR